MRIWLGLAVFCIGCGGCGGHPTGKFATVESAAPRRYESQQAQPGSEAEAVRTASALQDTAGEQGPVPQLRKITYTAQVAIVVEDFSQIEIQVAGLITKFGGYISESKVDRTRSTQRTGKWVARVPVDQFEKFLDAVVEIGVPETRDTNAQDVTEEYVDLEARIKNKREIERRMLKLLEDRSGDIKDVIAVESELGRVREEIERMEGRVRFLTNRISLTTVTITAREQQNYVPPQAPTFSAQIGQTWAGSVRTLKEFGRGLVLFAVGLTPWLPVLAFLVIPVGWLVRRLRRRPIGQPLSLPAARN